MNNRPNHVNNLLGEVFKRGGMKRAIKRAEAVLLWPQVAGSEVAAFTQAKSLKDGVLYVEVGDSETAMHLSFQRQKFLDVYWAKFGLKEIRDVRFRVGARVEPRAEEPPQVERFPADPRALALLARSLSNLPEDLAQPTMKLAKAMLAYRARRQAEGWKECLICQTLTPQEGICETCRRYGEQEPVKRAVLALAVKPEEPTPLLSFEERQVAIYQTQLYLKEKLQELLPQVLADPAMMPYLRFAAYCYVAHALGKRLMDVTEDDLDCLDARVSRVLGRWR